MHKTHDERRDGLIIPFFAVGAFLFALTRVFDHPLLQLLLFLYSIPFTTAGGLLLGWKWVNRLAANNAAKLLRERMLDTPPTWRSLPLPEPRTQPTSPDPPK